MKNTRLLYCVATLMVVGCVHHSPLTTDWIAAALHEQDSVLADPLLEEIVRDADRRRRQSNPSSGGVPVLPVGCEGFPLPGTGSPGLDWLFAQFRTRGGQTRETIGSYRPPWPWSHAVAQTAAPCVLRVEFSDRRDHSDPVSVANTLIHERVHSFGHAHAHGNKRSPNACDAAYVMGDAAEAILAHRRRLADYDFDAPMCQALCDALNARGMPHGCRRERGLR